MQKTGLAESLDEASNNLLPYPLQAGDNFYQDLSAARGSNALGKLERRIREAGSKAQGRLHVGFVGHRGSGKTTELLRIEQRLEDLFFPVHLYIDQTLHLDADYPDLFLWLVDELARKLAEREVKLKSEHLEKVAQWFAGVTKTETTGTKANVEMAGEAEISAKYGLLGNGLKLLARIKSAFIGSTERRTEMRQELKRYAQELLVTVNNFLGQASDALAKNGRRGRLLIVQDNLDRLSREAALALFRDNGHILTDLDGTFIWTAPIGSHMAPVNINNTFPVTSFMPTISVRDRKGERQKDAIEGLVNLAGKRLDIGRIFEHRDVLIELILASGGSIRDLLRLIESARLNALVEDHKVIQITDADAGIKEFSLGLQRTLIPGNVYFPILAETAKTKRCIADDVEGLTVEAVDARRAFFHQLILEGAILEYNGEETWHDVHPTLHKARLLREELEKLEAKPKRGTASRSKSRKGHGKGRRKNN